MKMKSGSMIFPHLISKKYIKRRKQTLIKGEKYNEEEEDR